MSGMSYAAVLALILQKIGGIPLFGAMRVRAEGTPVAKQLGAASILGLLPGGGLLSAALSDGLDGVIGDLASTFVNPVGAISDFITGAGPATLNDVVGSLVTAAQNGFITYSDLSSLSSLLNGQTYDSSFNPIGTANAGLAYTMPTYNSLTNAMSGVTLPNISTESANVNVINSITFSQVVNTITTLEYLGSNVSPVVDSTYSISAKINNAINIIVEPFSSNTSANLVSLGTLLVNLQANAVAGNINSASVSTFVSQLSSYKNIFDNVVSNTVSTFNVTSTGLDAIGYIGTVQGTLTASSVENTFNSRALQFINTTCRANTLSQIYPTIPPYITSISPSNGPVAGNTNVTIKGGYFYNVKFVSFDNNNSTYINVQDSNTIIVTTPSVYGSSNSYLMITTSAGTSSGNNYFQYV